MKTTLPAATPSDVELAELWEQHLPLPFPEGLRRVEIDGVDLVYLDFAVAGLVRTELNRGLDHPDLAALRTCGAELETVVPQITDPEGRSYFERLRTMARLLAARHAAEPDLDQDE
ncbi:hypothetical protein ACIBCA_09065 [Kitasatospora sp. NPDC051170]|uniref:hypothetical protein n=1 Tax=Kitasatospora sp. NPDC051170 TaxID=3364056 RepID=UPI0037B34A23